MKCAPSHVVRSIVALAANPATTEFFEIAKLVGAFGIRVHRCRICGILARGSETSVPIKVRGDTMIVVDGGVLAWMPLRMTDTHLWDIGTKIGRTTVFEQLVFEVGTKAG